jgi:hypothetical protein
MGADLRIAYVGHRGLGKGAVPNMAFETRDTSIAGTTREDREQIIRESLSCGGGGCEDCKACGVYGAGDAFEMYRDYIDGKLEIREINARFRAGFLR